MLQRVRWGKRKWNVYLNSKNIFIWASVTQVSDVAHGPLVCVCVYVSRNIWWYIDHDITPPPNRKCLSISKTVQIPTPKPYVFLFLVSRSNWRYVSHDCTRWLHTLLNRKFPNVSKFVEIPTPNHIYSCSLWQEAFGDMMIMTIQNLPVPLKLEVLLHLENQAMHHIYSCSLCQERCDGM
jgi:hypothetical protein